MDRNETDGVVHLLWVGIVVEASLILVALVLALWGLYDHRQPLQKLNLSQSTQFMVWGIAATIPLLVFLVVFHFSPIAAFRPMREFCRVHLQPIFQGSSTAELAILSILAGIGEELLFRWCLQGGISSLLETRAGMGAAMIIGLMVASILFGLCHWVNTGYGIMTMTAGAYFGLVMIGTGSWLVPAVAHALYDFVALLYIVRMDVGRDDD